MRIDNSYLAGLVAGDIRANAEAGETGQKAEIKAEKPLQVTTHVPSPELANLRQLLQVSPDVRPEAISRVSQVLESGYYQSSDAAGRTAEAIVKAIE